MKTVNPLVAKIFITIVVVSIICMFSITYTSTKNQYEKTASVLNLPFYQTKTDGDFKFASPFKEQRIHSMFMYRSLFTPDETLQNLEPDLATDFDVSSDGKTYTIYLADTNYWSDGIAVTPIDVMFTISAALKSTDIDPMFQTVASYIEGATDYKNGVTDEISGLSFDGNTITIKLDVLYNTFLPVLSQIVILPYHILKDENLENLHDSDYWENPVVSGMYKFDEYVAAENSDEDYLKLTHNKYYAEEKSDISEVRLFVNPNRNMLDFATTNNTQEMSTYNNAENYTYYDVEMLLYRFFSFNISGDDGNYNEVMDNVKIRQAILAAIDRDKILSSVFFGTGEILNSGVLSDNSFNNAFTHEYNPQKAKTLLQEAHYDFDYVFRIAYYDDNPQILRMLSYVVQNLEEIGITSELVFVPTEKERYIDREFDMLLCDYTGFNENSWYSQYDESNPVYRHLFINSPEFDGLFESLRESTNDVIRADYFNILQSLEQKHLYILPMFSLKQVVYIDNTRLYLPDNIKFGNSWYRYDIKLKDWKIKKS